MKHNLPKRRYIDDYKDNKVQNNTWTDAENV